MQRNMFKMARGPHGPGFVPGWRTRLKTRLKTEIDLKELGALLADDLHQDIRLDRFPQEMEQLLCVHGELHGTLIKDLYREMFNKNFPKAPKKLMEVLQPVEALGYCKLEMRKTPKGCPLLYVLPC